MPRSLRHSECSDGNRARLPSAVPVGALVLKSFDKLDALPDDALLNVTEVCSLFEVSHSALYVWLARGRLPRPFTRRPTRWRAADLRDCLGRADIGRPKKGNP